MRFFLLDCELPSLEMSSRLNVRQMSAPPLAAVLQFLVGDDFPSAYAVPPIRPLIGQEGQIYRWGVQGNAE